MYSLPMRPLWLESLLDPTDLPPGLCTEVRALLTAEAPYILIHTSPDEIQNSLKIVEAFQALRKGFPYRLVVLGTLAQEWQALQRADRRFARTFRHPVFPLHAFSPEELQIVAERAFALFTPSTPCFLPEPLRASIRKGKRLIAANTDQNRAHYRDTALYCDMEDAYSIECALRRILSHHPAGSAPPKPADTTIPPLPPLAPAHVALSSGLRDFNARQSLYFLHIPKAAGTSIRVLLEDRYPDGQICHHYYPGELRTAPATELQQYQLYRGHLGATLYPLLDKPVNTFAWMREPLDLLLSNYAFRIQEHLIPKTMSFSEWLEIIESDPVCKFLTMGLRLPEGNSPLSLFHGAVSVLQRCFLIGLVERHEDSVNLLCHHLGLYPPEVTAALNRTQSRPRVSDFTREIHDKVEKIVGTDRALYEWAAPLFQQRLEEMEKELGPEIAARFGPGEHPTTERVRAILRERFFQKQEAVPLCEEIDYTFDQPLIGEGWYERQSQGPNIPFGCTRWIAGDTCRAVIYLPIQQRRACRLRFGISEVYTPDALAGLRLAVNGVNIPLEPSSQRHPSLSSRHILQGVVPAEALQRASHLAQVTFTTNAYLSPIDRDPFTRDPRKFTVALNGITAHAIH